MITLGSSTSNRGLCFHRIRRRRGRKPDSGFSGLTFRLRPRFEFMEDRTLLSTFDVTDTADSGSGSLRQAILDSNAATAATNTIDFAIPGNGVQTISPLSALPPITQAVLVDGWSQPGYAGTPLIQIDGSQAGNSDGLTITGSNATVRGLDIGGFAQGAAIHTTGASAYRQLDLRQLPGHRSIGHAGRVQRGRCRDRRRRDKQYHRRDNSRRWQRDLGQRGRGDLDHRRWDHRGRRPAQFHRHRPHRYEGPGKRVRRRGDRR